MASIYASLSPKTVLRHDPQYFDRRVLFDAIACKAVELSPEQFIVLDELASQPMECQFARRLVDTVADDDSLTYEQLRAANAIIEGSEAELSRQPLLTGNRHTQVHAIPVTSTPTQLELCITRRCNQACIHCNVSAVGVKRKEKVDIQFWNDILEQCIELKVLKVTVTGGEPFLREDFENFYLRLAAAPIAVSILTNATYIPEYLMPIMSANGHTLSVSLDGTSSDVHDDFRRMSGAFEATLATMHKLAEHRVIFTINTVLHRQNIRNVEEVLRIADDVKAAAVVATPLGAVGRGAGNGAKAYHPDKEEFDWAIKELERLARATPADSSVALLNPGERELVEVKRTPGSTPMSRRPPEYCKAGVYAMAIDEDGMVYSCLRGLQERIYPLGDSKSERLRDIWEANAWQPFRGGCNNRVPCRVEDIQKNPTLYQIEY